ncbi:MAG: hypothetical protein V7603_778 [Micromonosporaceae bacterium]
MADLPLSVWTLVLIGVIGIPATTALGLFASMIRGDRNPRVAGTVAAGFAAVWAAWIVVSAVLADDGAYRQSVSQNRAWIGVAAGGALVAALLGTAIPAVGKALRGPGSLARLTVPHTFRVVGAAFIVVMALGKLPAAFALPAGLGDIAVGIAAPFIARRLAVGDRTGAIWFNILGILDLIVAVSIGFLAGLGPSRLLDVSPSTADVALLPLALIPTTAVPLALALHVTSLIRLRAAPVRVPHTPAVPA